MAIDGERESSTQHKQWEDCRVCEEEQPHNVWVEIIEEGTKNHTAARKPARFAECTVCGHTVKDVQTRRRPPETIREGSRPPLPSDKQVADVDEVDSKSTTG